MATKNVKNRKKLIIAIICVMIVVVLVITGVNVAGGHISNTNITYAEAATITPPQAELSSDKTQNKEEIKGHKLVAANDNYELYLKEDTLSIIVRDVKTGEIMESVVDDATELQNVNDTWKSFLQSGVVVEVQEDTNTMQKKAGVNNASVNVTYVDGGFKAKIDYPNYKFGFELEVLLYDDGSITAYIPESSIYEESDKVKIGNIYVFPMLGNTCLDEKEGYMFVPDGNGALIYLDDKEGRFDSGYTQRVYGSDIGIGESYVLSLLWDKYETHNDSENVLAPIFGMVYTDAKLGYLAVIEAGAEEATIMATPNGAYTDYNWITSSFRKSATYIQPTSNSGGSVTKVTDRIQYDIKIRYMFVNGDKANYTGLAEKYRDYLIEKGELQEKEDSFNIRLDFLGSDVENWLLSKKSVAMTTTDNIRDIYKELQSEGVNNIFSLYKGWQDGGIYDIPVTKVDTEGSIGSKSDLKKLAKDAKDMGIDFYLYTDGLRANPDTGNTTFNTVKKMDKRLYTESTYKSVYEKMVYWTPDKSVFNVNQLKDSMLDNGLNNLALSGISNTLFTYTISDTMKTRLTTEYIYKNMYENLDKDMNLVLCEPISEYWKYTDAFVDMPVSDSDFIYTDKSIPFLSIVLKGMVPMYSDYINFEANEREYFLKLVETGIYPSYYLTYEDSSKLIYTNSSDIYTSKYSTYKDRIIDTYNELKAIDDKTSGAYIVNHEILDNGVVAVTYDNGVRILVNYSDKEQTAYGETVDAMSYKVGEVQ
ncbi:hypothetical protein KQI85_08855 [Falcatimonas sp. MSJ-15]|uniref:DUF5696 domain-containing protein n=1 Tax=Falcatimonas sp. MSJ-15 TaxID=2841515 RepID=UPI001C11C02D|nr:DUF5696 domain-containing protein [Falcatimonas sp. MSJ-15]MBU5470483.1 hypothetical protein [Falcatimonas sp. MSJ-15]